MSLFERLEEFDRRLDMSLASRSENEELIREIMGLLGEKPAIDSVDGMAKKVRWEPDPPDYEREKIDQKELLDYLRYECG